MAEPNTPETLKKLAETLVNLPVKDIQALTVILEEEHGIKPASIAPVVAVAPKDQEGAGTVEEKTIFDVVLTNVGPNKLQVIKKIKDLLGVGLKEAKDAIDEKSLPNTLFEKQPKVKADELQKVLQETGATVELK